MTEVPISEARSKLSSIVDQARYEPVYLTRRNRRVAAVVDAGVLERLLEAAEDLADIEDATAAREEADRLGERPIPWEDVKRELGLT